MGMTKRPDLHNANCHQERNQKHDKRSGLKTPANGSSCWGHLRNLSFLPAECGRFGYSYQIFIDGSPSRIQVRRTSRSLVAVFDCSVTSPSAMDCAPNSN